MKSFKAFRLDRENHILWRNEDRVPMSPKEFDILAYLVEHAGRVVTQDQILDALWSDTYVNPEVLRKYILLSIAQYSYNGNSSACCQKAITSDCRCRIRRRALRA